MQDSSVQRCLPFFLSAVTCWGRLTARAEANAGSCAEPSNTMPHQRQRASSHTTQPYGSTMYAPLLPLSPWVRRGLVTPPPPLLLCCAVSPSCMRPWLWVMCHRNRSRCFFTAVRPELSALTPWRGTNAAGRMRPHPCLLSAGSKLLTFPPRRFMHKMECFTGVIASAPIYTEVGAQKGWSRD